MSCLEHESLLSRCGSRNNLSLVNLVELDDEERSFTAPGENRILSSINQHPTMLIDSRTIQNKAVHEIEAIQRITDLLRGGGCGEAALTLVQYHVIAKCSAARILQQFTNHDKTRVVAKLEEWCACAEGDIPVNLAQLCEVILSADPVNEVAWMTKVQNLITCGMFEEAVAQSSWALEACRKDSVVFFLQRGLSYAMIGQEQNAIKDYAKALNKDLVKTLSCAQTSQRMFAEPLLPVFKRHVTNLRANQRELRVEERTHLVKVYKLMLAFRPDVEFYCACAQLEKDLGNYAQVYELLCEGMTQCGGKDHVILTLERAECFLRMEKLPECVVDLTQAMKTDESAAKIFIDKLSQKHVMNLSVFIEKTARCMMGGLVRRKSLLTKLVSESGEDLDNLQQACLLYRMLILLQPRHRDYVFNCAESHRLIGENKQAIELYTFLLDHGHSFLKVYCARASCHINMGDYSSALEDCEAALKQKPLSASILCCRARCYVLAGEWARVLDDFIRASVLDMTTVVDEVWQLSARDLSMVKHQFEERVRHLLACRELTNQDSEELLRVGELLVRISPNDTHSFSFYADILVSLKKYDEAQAVIVRLVNDAPEDFLPLSHLAALRLKLGKVVSAVETYLQLFTRFGEERLLACVSALSANERAKISRESYSQGLQTLQDSQMFSDVIQLMSLAILVSDGNMSNAFLTRAKCHAHEKKFDDAVEDFSKALAIKPQSVEGLCGRGCMYLMKGNSRRATKDFLFAINTHAQATHQVLQTMPVDMRRTVHETVEAHAQKMFASCVKSGLNSYADSDDPMTCGDGILTLCQFLVEESPRDASYHSILADAHIVHAQYQTAASELAVAASLNDVDLSVAAMRGLVMIKLEDYESAVAEFVKLSESDVTGLLYTLTALNEAQKLLVAQEALNEAEILSGSGAHKLALPCLSLAAAATAFQNCRVLRSRAKCLQKLQLYNRAINDVTALMGLEKPQVSDLCSRAFLYILDDNETAACNDYMEAMATEEAVAMEMMALSPGRKNVLQAFKNASVIASKEKRFEDLFKICDFGLKLDPSDKELRRLKSKAELYMSKCSIQ